MSFHVSDGIHIESLLGELHLLFPRELHLAKISIPMQVRCKVYSFVVAVLVNIQSKTSRPRPVGEDHGDGLLIG